MFLFLIYSWIILIFWHELDYFNDHIHFCNWCDHFQDHTDYRPLHLWVAKVFLWCSWFPWVPRASSSGHTWPLQYHECVCIWIIKGPEYRNRISIRMKQKQPNHECVCIRIIEGLEYRSPICLNKNNQIMSVFVLGS